MITMSASSFVFVCNLDVVNRCSRELPPPPKKLPETLTAATRDLNFAAIEAEVVCFCYRGNGQRQNRGCNIGKESTEMPGWQLEHPLAIQ